MSLQWQPRQLSHAATHYVLPLSKVNSYIVTIRHATVDQFSLFTYACHNAGLFQVQLIAQIEEIS